MFVGLTNNGQYIGNNIKSIITVLMIPNYFKKSQLLADITDYS